MKHIPLNQLLEEEQICKIKERWYNMKYITNPSEKVQLEFVKKYPLNINLIIEKGIIPSEQVQLEAVKQNGNAIQYIINPSEQIKLEAVKNNGYAIQYITNPSEQIKLEFIFKRY